MDKKDKLEKHSKYEIPISYDYEDEIIKSGKQEVSFIKEKDVIYFGPETDPSSASISFNEGGPVFNVMVDDEVKSFSILSIKMDARNNFEIEVHPTKENEFSKININENEINIEDKSGETKLNVTLNEKQGFVNIALPENFFSLIADGSIATKNFPSQMFEAVEALPNVETFTLPYDYEGKNIKIAKFIGPETNEPMFFLNYASKMIVLDKTDMFSYTDTKTRSKKNSYIGLLAGNDGKGFKGIKINDITTGQKEEIVKFFEDGSSYKVQEFDDKEFAAQIVNFLKLRKDSEYEKEITIKAKKMENILAADKSTKEESEEKTTVAADKTEETSSKKGGTDDKGEKIEDEELKDKYKKLEEENKKLKEAKGKKAETVNLSHIAKLFGILGMIFGLFGGFGLLFQIIVMGVASSGWAYSKELEEVGKVKGSKAKKEDLAKMIDTKEKGDVEDEYKDVEPLVKDGYITKEEGERFKDLMTKTSKQSGYINKIETFMDKQIKSLTAEQKKLEDLADNTGNTKKKEKYEEEAKKLEDIIAELEVEQTEFTKYSENLKEQLLDATSLFTNFQENSSELVNLPKDIAEQSKQMNKKVAETTNLIDSFEIKISATIEELAKATDPEEIKKLTDNLETAKKNKLNHENYLKVYTEDAANLAKLAEQKKDSSEKFEKDKTDIFSNDNLEGYAKSVIKKLDGFFTRFRDKIDQMTKSKKETLEIKQTYNDIEQDRVL